MDEMMATALVIGNPPPNKIIVETPSGHPDILVQVVTPLMAVFARACNVFFQTLVGAIGATSTGIIPGDVWKTSLLMAGSVALVCVCQSLVTLSGNLEKQFPLLRA